MEKGVGARVLGIFRTDSGRGCGEQEVELRAGSAEMVASSREEGTSTEWELLSIHPFTLFHEHTS